MIHFINIQAGSLAILLGFTNTFRFHGQRDYILSIGGKKAAGNRRAGRVWKQPSKFNMQLLLGQVDEK